MYIFLNINYQIPPERETENASTNEIPNKADFWTNFTFIHINNGNWSNAVVLGWVKGDGSWGNPYIIENMTIDSSTSPTLSGIFIENSVNNYFIIRNCTIINNPYAIPHDAAIRLSGTNNGTIINNTLTNNYNSISLYQSENNTITNNLIENTIGFAIWVTQSNNNTVSYNDVRKGFYYGILIAISNNNSIFENTFNEFAGADYGSGIEITNSHSNYIENNNLQGNNNGIRIITIGSYNTIRGNNISNNVLYGVVITTSNCINNSLYNNIFNNPAATNNALDNGTDTKWDNGAIGNYWHDYNGKDEDDNGIGDTPYTIPGDGKGQDNYPIWDDGTNAGEPEPGKISSGLFFIYFMILGIAGALILEKRNKSKKRLG